MRLGINVLLVFLVVFSFSYGKTYVVKKGDTLINIAKKYKVSVEDIIKANRLKRPYIIRPGQKLKIPVKRNYSSRKKVPRSCAITHKVKPGDTLITIAKKYRVWVRDLRNINNLKSDMLRVGQVLCVKKSKNLAKKQKKQRKKVKYKQKVIKRIVYHTVKRGESIASIARKYNSSVNEIIKINRLKKPYIIRVGQKLKIPKKEIKIVKIDEKSKLEQLSKSMPFGFTWPVYGKIIADFANNQNVKHLGLDIKTDCSVPIRSAEAGKVIYAGNSIKAYGNLVVIKHRKSFNTVYGHVGQIVVKEGQFVNKGDIIGYTGKLNNIDGCGVYFEVRKDAIPVDPKAVLPEISQKKR